MRALGRLLVVLAAALGGISGAQLPEFAQQYRQRLGGALDELNRIVAQFDADAARNQLTREAALRTYTTSSDAFLRDQGESVSETLTRHEHLVEQRGRLESAPPIMRPVVVLSRPDQTLLRRAWADFEPAIPVTAAGFVWAAVGFFVLGGLVSMLRQLLGIARRRRARLRTAQPDY